MSMKENYELDYNEPRKANPGLTTVCSWCNRVLHDAGKGARKTHGICAKCLGLMKADYEAEKLFQQKYYH